MHIPRATLHLILTIHYTSYSLYTTPHTHYTLHLILTRYAGGMQIPRATSLVGEDTALVSLFFYEQDNGTTLFDPPYDTAGAPGCRYSLYTIHYTLHTHTHCTHYHGCPWL
jgi:hypothetical protein